MRNNIGSIILTHRKASGLTRSQLAKMAGVGKTVVFDIEHGKQTVRLETLMKIMKVLNIKMQLTSRLMETAEVTQ